MVTGWQLRAENSKWYFIISGFGIEVARFVRFDRMSDKAGRIITVKGDDIKIGAPDPEWANKNMTLVKMLFG
jgi:hypothetical protein